MAITIDTIHAVGRHENGTGPRSAIFAAIGILALWRERARQRRALAGLSADRLDDVGIDARAARIEAARPFWQG